MSGAVTDARRAREGIVRDRDARGNPVVSKRSIRWMETEGARIKFRPSTSSYVRKAPKVGRNDPCPCGQSIDGRPVKYKDCCGG
jgi:hypothetical protein